MGNSNISKHLPETRDGLRKRTAGGASAFVITESTEEYRYPF
jgi:hypothetical protein